MSREMSDITQPIRLMASLTLIASPPSFAMTKAGRNRTSPLDYTCIISHQQPRLQARCCLHPYTKRNPIRGSFIIGLRWAAAQTCSGTLSPNPFYASRRFQAAYFAAANAAALVPAMRPQTNALVMVKPMYAEFAEASPAVYRPGITVPSARMTSEFSLRAMPP